MCLATPLKIKKIKEKMASVEHGGRNFNVSLSLIPGAKIGDWILAHSEMAISIIPEKDALEILNLIKAAEESKE